MWKLKKWKIEALVDGCMPLIAGQFAMLPIQFSFLFNSVCSASQMCTISWCFSPSFNYITITDSVCVCVCVCVSVCVYVCNICDKKIRIAKSRWGAEPQSLCFGLRESEVQLSSLKVCGVWVSLFILVSPLWCVVNVFQEPHNPHNTLMMKKLWRRSFTDVGYHSLGLSLCTNGMIVAFDTLLEEYIML